MDSSPGRLPRLLPEPSLRLKCGPVIQFSGSVARTAAEHAVASVLLPFVTPRLPRTVHGEVEATHDVVPVAQPLHDGVADAVHTQYKGRSPSECQANQGGNDGK